jgi:hypothetical protein
MRISYNVVDTMRLLTHMGTLRLPVRETLVTVNYLSVLLVNSVSCSVRIIPYEL